MTQPYYQSEGITIYHGDCRAIVPELPMADAVVTDPPYGVGFKYMSYDDDPTAWFVLMDEMVPKMRAAAPFVVMPVCRIDRMGWWYANHEPGWIIAWYKGSPGHRSLIGFNDWEAILVWGKPYKKMHDHFQTISSPMCTTTSERVAGHPCAKPIAWASWLVERSVPEGGVLVDPFMGSGTTLVAAKHLHRQAIGIEIDERYCELAANRLAQGVLPFDAE